jgi:hypothetical protein
MEPERRKRVPLWKPRFWSVGNQIEPEQFLRKNLKIEMDAAAPKIWDPVETEAGTNFAKLDLLAGPSGMHRTSYEVAVRDVAARYGGQSSRFSRVFSSSSDLSRLAWEPSIPSICLRFVLASLSRACGTDRPASCSFNITMICSSEKRLRFVLWSSYCARASFNSD